MPMSFPDMDSLIHHAELYHFRVPFENETEEEYRKALADFVEPIDLVESHEIRNGVGWDEFNESQGWKMLFGALKTE